MLKAGRPAELSPKLGDRCIDRPVFDFHLPSALGKQLPARPDIISKHAAIPEPAE